MTESNTETSKPALSASDDQRMKLYDTREKAFYDFLEECECRQQQVEPAVEEERPLSGLQCLLALTEILDRAARLRESNYHLEQRIEILQRFKFIAEVQNELNNAKLDINANSLVKHKKNKGSEDIEEGRLKRSYSAESLEAFTPTTKLESSSEEFSKLRSGNSKSSKLSETWGKVKDKLAHKESISGVQSASKASRRHRSADTAGSLRLSINLDTPSPTRASSTTSFTQREINISPPHADDGDFGGVWLGGDSNDSSTAASTTATTTNTMPSEYGGVYLGPPSIVHLHREENSSESINQSLDRGSKTKEKVERKTSEPATIGRVVIKPDYHHKVSADMTSSRSRTCSYDENPKSPNNDNQSPTFLRKKSSRLIAQATSRLPGSEQKKVRKVENTAELPKEFRKKIEQWHVMKETVAPPPPVPVPTQQTTQVSTRPAKASKQKVQRLKNKRRGGFLKQRSKSAERVEDQFHSPQLSDEFEEKLREWSLKQGFHPTYYSDVRRQMSNESVIGLPLSQQSNRHVLNKSESLDLAKDEGRNRLTINTQTSSSCTESTASLSPAVTLDSFYSAENLQTLSGISQSSEGVCYRRRRSSTNKAAHKLSRSEEALNVSSTCHVMLPLTENLSSYAASSNIDLYARASDHSLEKHLSLYHVASESSLNLMSASSSEQLSRPSISTRSSHISADLVLDDADMQHDNSKPQLGESVQQETLQNGQNNDDLHINENSLHITGSDQPQSACDCPDFEDDASEVASNNQVGDQMGSNIKLKVQDNKVQIKDSEKSECCDHAVDNVFVEGENNGTELNSSMNSLSLQSEDATVSSVTGEASLSTGSDVIVPAVENEVTLNDWNKMQTERVTNCKTVTSPFKDDKIIACGNSIPSKQDGRNKLANKSLSLDLSIGEITSTSSDITPQKCVNQDAADKPVDYDINSNVTGNDSNSKVAESLTASPLYVGTEVPLKLRLKSLAMEYEVEDSKRQKRLSDQSADKRSTHKRTRSYDLFSNTGVPNSAKPITSSNKVTPLSNYRCNNTNRAPSTSDTPTSKSSGYGSGVTTSLSKAQTQRSNVHRLKSAEELIYEQSVPPSTTSYQLPRSTSSHIQYPKLDVRNRRELFEKPKEGTVKKAMSIFRDGGAFNAQFGTDFVKAVRPQPT